VTRRTDRVDFQFPREAKGKLSFVWARVAPRVVDGVFQYSFIRVLFEADVSVVAHLPDGTVQNAKRISLVRLTRGRLKSDHR
jgi:hypothetical protein